MKDVWQRVGKPLPNHVFPVATLATSTASVLQSISVHYFGRVILLQVGIYSRFY